MGVTLNIRIWRVGHCCTSYIKSKIFTSISLLVSANPPTFSLLSFGKCYRNDDDDDAEHSDICSGDKSVAKMASIMQLCVRKDGF